MQHLPALDLCLYDHLTASTGETELCYNVPAVPVTEADRNWQATLATTQSTHCPDMMASAHGCAAVCAAKASEINPEI